MIDGLDLTANHSDQLAVFGADITTRDGRIQALDAESLEIGGDFLCKARRAGRVVNQVRVMNEDH